MTATLIHTAPLKAHLMEQIKEHVITLKKLGILPHLHVVLIGEHPASKVYVNGKKKAAEAVGIACTIHRLSTNTTQIELADTISRLNDDPQVSGILVQLPLPNGLNAEQAINLIHPLKDVDGLTAANKLARMTGQQPYLLPATPLGIMRILMWQGETLKDTPCVVIGRSDLVGAPVVELLTQAGAHVTNCHLENPVTPNTLKQARIIVSATGVAGLIKAEDIAPNAFLIDVGIQEQPDPSHPKGKKLVGDVCPSCREKGGIRMTPVPGGVGPMTITSLLTNVVDAAYFQAHKEKPDWDMDAT